MVPDTLNHQLLALLPYLVATSGGGQHPMAIKWGSHPLRLQFVSSLASINVKDHPLYNLKPRISGQKKENTEAELM